MGEKRKEDGRKNEGGGVGRKEKREGRGTEGEKEQRRDDEEREREDRGMFFKICVYNRHHVPGAYCTL